MFYSISDFAKQIGVSVYTLRYWEKTGKFMPHHKTPGGKRMYSDEQVAEFLGKTPNKDITISFINGKPQRDSFTGLSFEEVNEVIKLAKDEIRQRSDSILNQELP